MALADPLTTESAFYPSDESILDAFSQHSSFDDALNFLVGNQNGRTEEMKTILLQRYNELLPERSAHELIVSKPRLAFRIIDQILTFKLDSAIPTSLIFKADDSYSFPEAYSCFDYFTNYLVGYVFAQDLKGFLQYMQQISGGKFNEEDNKVLFDTLWTNFVSKSQQFVTKQYEGLIGNNEPVVFRDQLPSLSDLMNLNLFTGFIVEVEHEGTTKQLLVRIVHPQDEKAKGRVSEARELGYARFGAGGKKNRKVMNYEFGTHTILEVLSLDDENPKEYATAEVMIDRFIGTEGQRLLSNAIDDMNPLVENIYSYARSQATTPQEFIDHVYEEHRYLPGYIRSRSRPDEVAEVGTLAFKTIDKGRDKPSLPANILGGHMIYLILTMASAIAQRRGITKMVGIFQEYLQKTLELNGANVILDEDRKLDVLGINNLGPDGNGTATNFEYYLSHANYFLAGSKILIPIDLKLSLEEGSIDIQANSYLVIDKSLQHKIKLLNPDGSILWEPNNRDMFTTKGLDIAKQVLGNAEVKTFLIRNWEYLLKSKPEDEGKFGDRGFMGYIQGPGYYYQDSNTLVDGLISKIVEDKKKLNLNSSTTTMIQEATATEVSLNMKGDLSEIFNLDATNLPPIPDLKILNHYNSLPVSPNSDTWERLVEDLQVMNEAESNRFIHRELTRDAFLYLIGMRKGEQVSINMPTNLSDMNFDPEDGALRWDLKTEPDYFNCTILDFTQGQFAKDPVALDKCRFILVGHGRQKYLYIISDVEKFEAIRMCKAWATLTSIKELDRRIIEAEEQGLKLVGTPLYEAILADPLLKKLREHTSIAIVGQGTAGRPTAKAMAQLGVKAMTLYELPSETVSLTNTQRLTGQNEIGLSKLMVSATEYQTANPFTEITLGGELNEETIELLNSTDLVILAADQPAQVLIHEYCYKKGIDVLLGTDIGYGSEVLFFEYSSPDVQILNGAVTLEQLRDDPKAVLKMLNIITVLTQGDPETLYAFTARNAGHLQGLPQNQFAPLVNAATLGKYVTSIIGGTYRPTMAYVDPDRIVEGKSKFQRLIENLIVLYKTRKLTRKLKLETEV